MIQERISHYRIMRKLGAGAMGDVYLAEDTRLGRQVALKIIARKLARDEDRKRRFVLEARSASALNHPNILTIHDIGSDAGHDFIAMEYVEGVTLRDRIRADAPFTGPEIARIGSQLAAGLARAHEAGIVHRDIKPENIMVRPDGYVKILDFGLSKLRPEPALDTAETVAASETRPGIVLGTPRYMSPEQARGRDVDHRSDIFSLGCVLYEMATGRAPFEAESAIETMHAVIHDEAPSSAETIGVSPSVQRALDKCLAKDPGDRYQHADELSVDLQRMSTDDRTPVGARISWPRLLTTLGAYLLIAWGLVQLTRWATDRFVVSPHWSSLVFMAVALLIPAAVLIGLSGRPGLLSRRAAQLAVVVNVVLAAAVILVRYQDEDLGAATTEVVVETEEGEIIQRVVPKTEFRKRFVVYNLQAAADDSTQAWLGEAVPYMLAWDLAQDMFVYLDPRWTVRAREAGFSAGAELPFSLQRRVALDRRLEFFASGTVAWEADGYQVHLILYDTQSGREVTRVDHQGDDLFALVDRLSVDLRRAIGVPQSHIESVTDLPIAETFTSSIPALRAYTRGRSAHDMHQDWELAVSGMEEAVAADSTFAAARLLLMELYVGVRDFEARARVVDELMGQLYKLPETAQFLAKTAYYDVRQDPDKQLAVVRMWTELYPGDPQGHQFLALLLLSRGQRDEAIAAFQRSLDLDPEQSELLESIGELQRDKGDVEGALQTYAAYARRFPADSRPFLRMAQIEADLGGHHEARENIQRALAIDPGDMSARLLQATISTRLGDFSDAQREFAEALADSRTPQDRAAVCEGLLDFHRLRGELEEAMEWRRKWLLERSETTIPLYVSIMEVMTIDLMVEAGQYEAALERLAQIEAEVGPPLSNLIIPMAHGSAQITRGDGRLAARSIVEAESAMRSMQVTMLEGHLAQLRGQALELEGDLPGAMAAYEASLSLMPQKRADVSWRMGRCLRQEGRHREARERIEATLHVIPVHPEANYEMALLLAEMGEQGTAWEHLRIALRTWENADAGYRPAGAAWTTAAAWQADL